MSTNASVICFKRCPTVKEGRWISASRFAIQLYGQDHLVVRQLLPKKPGSPSPAVSASGPDGKAQKSTPVDGRILEFRRLSETAPQADWTEQMVKAVALGDSETEALGTSSKMQHEREELVQNATIKQIAQRTLQVQRYGTEAQESMEAISHMMAEAAEDFEEVVYTLGNWTMLLEPELRVRAETARERMQGILKDPGVRGAYSQQFMDCFTRKKRTG